MYTTAVIALVAIPLTAYYYYVVRSAKLTLTIEITGGFAYVSPNAGDNHLNIAYLDTWTDAACPVEQVGTEMKLIVGDIVAHEPSAKPLPPDREFKLDKAIVRFPAVEAANQALTMVRDKFTDPPPGPANPDDDKEWKKNLKWIPSIKEYHSGTTIRPDWRDKVNGRMELRGGEIVATTPSIPTYKKAKFDFRQNGVSKHKVSTTDKSIYTIKIPISDLPGGNLEITLSNATNGFTKLVIKPQGNKVELQLTGLHKHGAPDLYDGDPLTDFCTFYQLLEPMPAPADFLVPHFMKAPALASTAPSTNAATTNALTGAGQPSPGLYCFGDWF
jgi:hypothetical protein